jgi:predicted ATPase
MKINKIKLSGFKSIADVELNDLTPFSVFAGANGAGKSNFFDALDFISTVVTFGATQALRKFNGYDNVHCFKHRGKKAKIFNTSFHFDLDGKMIQYDLESHNMDDAPKLVEQLLLDGEIVFHQTYGVIEVWEWDSIHMESRPDRSMLTMYSNKTIWSFFNNIKVYRFDPLGAKEPDSSSADTTGLNSHGHNIATMLSVLEKDADIREQIIEWMELLVPGLEKLSTERSRLDARTMIRFKETGLKKQFPAHLISDGTIYALCIMVAVLGRCKQPGMTLIEEPERGIHPQAIAELVSLMRENANPNHAIFVTTHSESVVRHSKPEELWLVNKIDGKTEFKNAGKKFSNLGDLSLDKAWLMNFFGGGLPW